MNGGKAFWDSGEFALMILAVMLIGAGILGGCSVKNTFRNYGYVLIRENGVEAVATVTPIFQEWGR